MEDEDFTSDARSVNVENDDDFDMNSEENDLASLDPQSSEDKIDEAELVNNCIFDRVSELSLSTVILLPPSSSLDHTRRDRINEKLKALQELLPNYTKTDNVSMLDAAIDNLMSLQLQLQEQRGDLPARAKTLDGFLGGVPRITSWSDVLLMTKIDTVGMQP